MYECPLDITSVAKALSMFYFSYCFVKFIMSSLLSSARVVHGNVVAEDRMGSPGPGDLLCGGGMMATDLEYVYKP